MIFILLPGKYEGARGSLWFAHRDTWRMLPGCCGDAAGTLGDAVRDARGALGVLTGSLRGCQEAAGGWPAPRHPSGCAPRAPLRAPRRGWRSGGAGGRRRGGEGVVSPARLSRRPGSINEIIMQKKQPCATRQPYLILAGGEVGQGCPWAPLPRGGLAQGWQCQSAWHSLCGDPAAIPRQPDTPEGHGWARPTACARSILAPPPCPGTLGDPARPGPVLFCQSGCRGTDCR